MVSHDSYFEYLKYEKEQNLRTIKESKEEYKFYQRCLRILSSKPNKTGIINQIRKKMRETEKQYDYASSKEV